MMHIKVDYELYGLAFGCPHLNREEGCPFIEYDHFSFKEKVCLINGLNPVRIKKIIEYHKDCSKNRF